MVQISIAILQSYWFQMKLSLVRNFTIRAGVQVLVKVQALKAKFVKLLLLAITNTIREVDL